MTRAQRRNLQVAIAVLAAIVAYQAWAYSYPAESRQMAVLVGWIGIILCTLDVIAHTDTRAGHVVALLMTGSSVLDEHLHNALGRECAALAWMALATALVILCGFLVGVPIYVVAYMTIHGRKGVALSVAAAAGIALFMWGVFEQMMSYPLYGGFLLGD